MAKDPEPGRQGVDSSDVIFAIVAMAVIVVSMLAVAGVAVSNNPAHEAHSEQGCEK